ncbi:MAG TPA: HAD-IC family P-type ATPase [Oculatellaceae cyanobacterium]
MATQTATEKLGNLISDLGCTLVHSLTGRSRYRLPAVYREPDLAASVQHCLQKQAGVTGASVNPYSASVTINFVPGEFEPETWLSRITYEDVRRYSPHSPLYVEQKKLPAQLAHLRKATFAFEDRLPPKIQFMLGALSLVCSVIELPVFVTRAVLSFSLLPIANRALQTLLDERRVGADFLDTVGCLLLMAESRHFPASLMMTLIGLGEYIRDLVTASCQQLISHQLALSERSAWLIKGKDRIRIPISELKLGARLVVYEGDLIAFEGTITEGEGTLVPAHPEEDFEPRTVKKGDRVTPDTVLTDGKLYVRNELPSSPRVKDPVMEKQHRRWLQRTQLHRDSLRIGYKRLGYVLSGAVLLYLVTRNVSRAASLIYFDFLTGIKIAIPAAFLASMYRAGNRGIVIRNARTLERLAQIDTIIFVRSGTLTALKPSVTDVFVCNGFSVVEVMRLAAAIEERYNHLTAFAIYSYANLQRIPVPDRTSSHVVSGLGITGVVEGHAVVVGSTRLMEQNNIDLAEASTFLNDCQRRAESRVCVAIDGSLAGVISYQDPVRENASEVIAALKNLKIDVAMATGGSQAAAEGLAKKVGIENIHYRVSPEEQATIIKSYKERGKKVAVVGYDVDDLLALEQADVAIVLATGTEVTRYRADMIVTSDSLLGLVEAIQIARNGMDLARQNLAVVSVPNWCGIALSVIGMGSELTATLLNNGPVILGAANGLRPLLDEGAPPWPVTRKHRRMRSTAGS